LGAVVTVRQGIIDGEEFAVGAGELEIEFMEPGEYAGDVSDIVFFQSIGGGVEPVEITVFWFVCCYDETCSRTEGFAS